MSSAAKSNWSLHVGDGTRADNTNKAISSLISTSWEPTSSSNTTSKQLSFQSPLLNTTTDTDASGSSLVTWFTLSRDEYDTLKLQEQLQPLTSPFQFTFETTLLLTQLYDSVGYGNGLVILERFKAAMLRAHGDGNRSTSQQGKPLPASLDDLTHDDIGRRFFGCARAVLTSRSDKIVGLLSMADTKGVPSEALQPLRHLLSSLKAHPLMSSLSASYLPLPTTTASSPLPWELSPSTTPSERAEVLLSFLVSEVDAIGKRGGRRLAVVERDGLTRAVVSQQGGGAPPPQGNTTVGGMQSDASHEGAIMEAETYLSGLRTIIEDLRERGTHGAWEDDTTALTPTSTAAPPQPHFLPNTADLTSWEHMITTFDKNTKHSNISNAHKQLRMDVEEKLDDILHGMDPLATSCVCTLQRRELDMARNLLSRNIIVRRQLQRKMAIMQQYQRVVLDVLTPINCSSSVLAGAQEYVDGLRSGAIFEGVASTLEAGDGGGDTVAHTLLQHGSSSSAAAQIGSKRPR